MPSSAADASHHSVTNQCGSDPLHKPNEPAASGADDNFWGDLYVDFEQLFDEEAGLSGNQEEADDATDDAADEYADADDGQSAADDTQLAVDEDQPAADAAQPEACNRQTNGDDWQTCPDESWSAGLGGQSKWDNLQACADESWSAGLGRPTTGTTEKTSAGTAKADCAPGKTIATVMTSWAVEALAEWGGSLREFSRQALAIGAAWERPGNTSGGKPSIVGRGNQRSF